MQQSVSSRHSRCRDSNAPPLKRRSFSITFAQKNNGHRKAISVILVGEGGFEPPKSLTTDLQSAPFGHSGIPPYSLLLLGRGGAGRRTRTPDLLITNQLLYQLSYTSTSAAKFILPEENAFVKPVFWVLRRKIAHIGKKNASNDAHGALVHALWAGDCPGRARLVPKRDKRVRGLF